MGSTEPPPGCTGPFSSAHDCPVHSPRRGVPTPGGHDATPTPPAPADAKCNAPGCSVCAAGLPHTTHSYPMTAPAPADDAREKGLAAYDALNMREKSEIAAQDPRYCYAKGYVAALAGRADDASGAEAMAPGCHEHVALWDAINAYSVACGGHPTRGGGARMDAVARVEKALRAALRREKGGGHG